jgi:hypothetical protein
MSGTVQSALHLATLWRWSKSGTIRIHVRCIPDIMGLWRWSGFPFKFLPFSTRIIILPLLQTHLSPCTEPRDISHQTEPRHNLSLHLKTNARLIRSNCFTLCRRNYAINQKVMGSIPNETIGFSTWPNPSSRIMALGLIQPLTDKSTRYLPEGKGWLTCA